MASSLLTFVILILSCHLAPIIQASKPVLAKSTHTIPKSESVTTITPPTKRLPHKNAGFRKSIVESAVKKVDAHGTGTSTDPIEVTNELKLDTTSFLPWNSFANSMPYPLSFPMPNFPSLYDASPFSALAKFMPFFGYSQPLFVPYPVMMPSEMFYPSYGEAQTTPEDTMSRTSGSGRRPIHSNSPIYYVRLPPSPYMFMPSFNYAPSPFLPYSPLSTIHAFPMSSIFNMPLNFLANGKPNGIYRIDGTPNELPNNHLPFAGARPTQLTNSFRPISFNLPPPSTASSSAAFSVHGSGSPLPFPSSSSSSSGNQHDSKLNTFKHPFVFNGRPEDIYILPNNMNPSIYSESSFFK